MESGSSRPSPAHTRATSDAPRFKSPSTEMALGATLPRWVIAIGLALTAGAYWAARDSARYRLKAAFDHRADLGIHLIRDQLHAAVRDLEGTRRFMEWQNPPSRPAFASYAEPVAERPGTLGIGWAPRVRAAEAATLEATIRQEGRPEFRIHAPSGDRRSSAVGDPAHEHVAPLRFVSPSRFEQRFAGLDLLAVPRLADALLKAQTNTQTHVSPSGIDEVATNSFTRFAAVMAVRAADTERPPDGFLVGFYSVHALIEDALTDSDCDDLAFTLVDEHYQGAGNAVICRSPLRGTSDPTSLPADQPPAKASETAWVPGLKRDVEFEFAGRTWCIEVHATEPFVASMSPGWPTWIPPLGILLTALAGFAARQAAAHDRAELLRREQDERRLREAEERFALIIRGTDLGTWDWDVPSGNVVINDRWFEMLGYRPGEIPTHVTSWEKSIHPDDFPRVRTILNDHLEGRTSHYLSEHRLRHKAGHWVWILDRGIVFQRDPQGRPLRACGTHQDITTRKEAEKALARFALANERLRDASAAIHRSTHRTAAFDTLLDEALDLAGVACGALGMVDRPRSAIQIVSHRGLTAEVLHRLSSLAPNHPALRLALETRGTMPIISRDDLSLPPSAETDSDWHHFRTLPIDDGKPGAALLFLGFAQLSTPDSTVLEALHILGVETSAVLRRLSIEAELRGSQERLQLSLHAARLGVWEWDATTHEISWSPLCPEILGTESFDGRLESVRQCLHPEDAATASSNLLRALENRASFTTELRTSVPAASPKWISVVARGIHHPDGRLARVVGILQDLTERRRMEEQLREVQRLEGVGQLAGGIAHEFNNILAAILLNQTLIDDGCLSGLHLESLSEIRSLTHRAANLVRQLLAFSQKATLDPATLELNELLTSTARLLEPLLGESIRLDLNPALHPVYIRADRRLIEQVLLNLGLNARDAMPHGGKLTLGLRTDSVTDADATLHAGAKGGPHACLTVVDDGIGMEDSVLKKLFQPFFTTKEVGRGTGLGLATAHGIIRQHRGWIRVSSRPGAGSTFEVLLPAIDTPEPPAPPAAPHEPATQPTLLLVEDEASLRRATAMLLRRLRYVVLDAATPDEARALWTRHGLDIGLLLTDLVLPGGTSGADLAREFRRQNPQLRVIVSSGYNLGHERLEESLPEGAVFLAKPCPPAAIEAAVRSALPSPTPPTAGSA